MESGESKPFALGGSNNPVVTNWLESGRDIYLDEFYFISYSDQKRMLKFHGIDWGGENLSKAEMLEQQREVQKQLSIKFPKYYDIISWVGMDQYKAKAIAELPAEQNPNYIKITGRMLLVWAEQGFVPQFDEYFDRTRKLLMMPVEAYDHFHSFSYMLRKKGWYRNK